MLNAPPFAARPPASSLCICPLPRAHRLLAFHSSVLSLDSISVASGATLIVSLSGGSHTLGVVAAIIGAGTLRVVPTVASTVTSTAAISISFLDLGST
jgi:hypothetical protein